MRIISENMHFSMIEGLRYALEGINKNTDEYKYISSVLQQLNDL